MYLIQHFGSNPVRVLKFVDAIRIVIMVSMNHLASELSAEIRQATVNLPPYRGGPGVDYTNAVVAYTAAVTLLHLPGGQEVSSESEILLVRKGQGDWHTGVWGSVTGYIDTVRDPQRQLADDEFDPVAFTARSELAEECGLTSDDIAAIDFRLGQRFAEGRFNGKGTIHIVPILGLCSNERKPSVQPDGHEVTDYSWVPLNQVASRPALSPGYITRTLPNALGAFGAHGVRLG